MLSSGAKACLAAPGILQHELDLLRPLQLALSLIGLFLLLVILLLLLL